MEGRWRAVDDDAAGSGGGVLVALCWCLARGEWAVL